MPQVTSGQSTAQGRLWLSMHHHPIPWMLAVTQPRRRKLGKQISHMQTKYVAVHSTSNLSTTTSKNPDSLLAHCSRIFQRSVAVALVLSQLLDLSSEQ